MNWQPIETAPKTRQVLLCISYLELIFVGQFRTGNYGEPNQGELCWRANCCGKIAGPDSWAELPAHTYKYNEYNKKQEAP